MFSEDFTFLPHISYPNVYHYLVETECVYTREAVRAYKSHDTYNYFFSGKVMTKYVDNDLHVVYREAEANQTLQKSYGTRVIVQRSREVCSGHCTCTGG